MSWQYVIDNAESISINRLKKVSSTEARDGTVKATSLGGQVWTFTVKLPDGPRWSDNRQSISQIEALDRVANANIQFNTTGTLDWFMKYQGNCANVSGITATVPSSGNTITLTGGQAASGYNFRAGDIVQLGSSGHCYTVTADVAYNSNTVTLHRPIIDSAGSVTLRVGPNCVFNVVCTQFPQWTIFERNQVSWSGPFILVENLN